METIIGAFVGGFLGVVSTLLGGWMVYSLNKRSQRRFSASILKNDLKSIERYLIYDETSRVNLRYSNNWQKMVANCTFLKNEDIEFLYLIYDEIYNYNYLCKLVEQGEHVEKDKSELFKNLRARMFDTSKNDSYNKLMKRLEKHTKK